MQPARSGFFIITPLIGTVRMFTAASTDGQTRLLDSQ